VKAKLLRTGPVLPSSSSILMGFRMKLVYNCLEIGCRAPRLQDQSQT
jgi:hypothetical protein